jgi:tetratricopeptide (TPR) repeat protein
MATGAKVSTQQPFPSGYSAEQASKLLDLPLSQIRNFVEAGFLTPRSDEAGEYRFSFQDLVLLRTAKGLTDKLSPRKVRDALKHLRDQLPKGRELSALRITAEGDTVVVHDGKSAWNPASGQTVISFEVSELAAEVAPLAREAVQAAREGDRDLSADDWYELGCDLEMEDPEEARDAYRRAIELKPLHPDAHLNVGRLLHEAGEVQAAEEHYRLALAVRPEDPTAAYNLGVSLQDLERFPEAVHAYDRALKSDPGNADAHYNLAQVYEAIGKPMMAFRHLQIYKKLIEQGDTATPERN